MRISQLDCYMKAVPFILLFASISFASHAIAEERFPVLKRIDQATAKSMNDVLAWQRSFEDMRQSDLTSKLGKPDKTEQLGTNPVTKKAMQALIYRVSRRSDVRFTIHEGKVAAISVILQPSANEDGPIDD
jgi:hypothetical protein